MSYFTALTIKILHSMGRKEIDLLQNVGQMLMSYFTLLATIKKCYADGFVTGKEKDLL